MPRRRWVIGLAGGLLSCSLALNVGVPSAWAARGNRSQNRACAQEAAKSAEQEWQSLSPAERQQLIDQGEQKAKAAMKKWQSMTPEQLQQAKERAAKQFIKAKHMAEKRCQEQQSKK